MSFAADAAHPLHAGSMLDEKERDVTKERAFLYELGQTVKFKESREAGTIIGRAEYLTSEPAYFVRYCAGDGRQTEAWWGESSLLG